MSAAAFTAKRAENGAELKLAMQRLWVTGRVAPAGAVLTVEHVFRSAEAQPLEVVYGFPLPADAALRRFRIVGQTFDVRSELHPATDALRLYEKALSEGSLAALAREHQDGVVNLTVGNIRPGETVRVLLEIIAGVELRDDGFRFRFPFTLGPVYHSGMRASAEGGEGEWELPADPFGDVLLPPVRKDASGLHEVGFGIDVPSAVEIGSPSHSIRVRRETDGDRVMLAPVGDLPDRDLVLDARFGTPRTVVFGGPKHYAAVTPSTMFGTRPTGSRRIVIVLDRSGSMQGTPIEQAKRSVAACLAVLSEQDLFGLVAFDDRAESFTSSLVNGSREHRDRARQFLDGVGARGGTEFLAGLDAASKMLGEEGGEVFLLTDGQVGGYEPILARARQGRVRLHCLGIGSASHDRLLGMLARETGGVSRSVTPRERVDMEALELFASAGLPVASGLEAHGPVTIGVPARVYSGTPVLVFATGPVELKWIGGSTSIAGGDDEGAEPTVRLLEGARLIAEASGDAKLLELSRRYGLASRAMSLVAVVKRESDMPGELPVTRVVPVGMPRDVNFDSYFGAPMAAPPAPMQAASALMTFGSAPPRMPGSRSSSGGGFMRSLRERVSSRQSASPKKASSSAEDKLMDLAASMEPDGGMPGKNVEERVRKTLEAIRKFLDAGHTSSHGAFRTHVQKLADFLRKQQGLGTKLKAEVDEVLGKV